MDSNKDFLEYGGYHYQNHPHPHPRPHPQPHSRAIVKITFLFVVAVLICLVLNQPTNYYPTQILEKSYSFLVPKDECLCTSSNLFPPSDIDDNNKIVKVSPFQQFASKSSANVVDDENNLETILEKASMKDYNKTVIITTLNAAWSEPNNIFDYFLESFRIGDQTEKLLKHLVVVAIDKKAYARCLAVQLHCYALTNEGVDHSGEALFMTEDYLKLMWRRIDFLRTVLEMGYNFVFTDADVMWLRDPFPRFYPAIDFQIACDHYNSNATDLHNLPNGGFNYVRSNNRTIKFYKYWYTGKDYFPQKHDQDVLNKIKFGPFLKEIGLQIRFLDNDYFGGFCQPSKDLDSVVTMHANCCFGSKKKIHDITMAMNDWKKYRALPESERNASIRAWTVPRLCGPLNLSNVNL